MIMTRNNNKGYWQKNGKRMDILFLFNYIKLPTWEQPGKSFVWKDSNFGKFKIVLFHVLKDELLLYIQSKP